MSQSLRQVATYNVSCGVSLRIFEEQSSTSSIPRLLIAEPLLDWQRDEQGRPLINAVSRVQGGGAVFELRLIISTEESQQAVQRAVSSKPRLAEMELITQIDSVNLGLSKGTMGELLEFCGGEMYPSRSSDIAVKFESPSLTTSKEDIEKVRSILRAVRLICKASVNGHELPPISLSLEENRKRESVLEVLTEYRCEYSPTHRPPVLIAEPALYWQRDEQGRPLINAVSKVQGGGAVFELRLILNTPESQQAAHQAASSNPEPRNMELITQVDAVNLSIMGELGNALQFKERTLFPSRNCISIGVKFKSLSLTTSEEDIDEVRSILRSIRLICKASVNGHELPPISLDFSTSAPPSTAPPALTPPPPTSTPPRPPPPAAAVYDAIVVNRPLRVPHSPRTVNMPFATCGRLAWTPSGNLVATTYGPNFYILKPNGEIIRQINSGSGLEELACAGGVAVSDGGLIFISDWNGNKINVYTEEGEFVRLFGGPGHGIGRFNGASSVAISKKTGNLFIADFNNHRVQVFNQAGNFLSFFGSAGTEPGQLNAPVGIDIDDDDNIFVAENLGDRVSVFTLEGQFLRSFGSAGSLPGQFKTLQQLYIDRSSDRIFIADSGNLRIQILNKFGAVERVINTGTSTHAILADRDGKVIIGGFGSNTMLFYDN